MQEWHKLDSRTQAYFLERLSNGNTLSQTLLKSIEFAHGSYVTSLPNVTDFNSLYEFDYGGKALRNESLKQLQSLIKDFLAKSTQSALVVEHALASKDDPWLKTAKDRYVFVDDYVAWIKMHNDEITYDQIQKITGNMSVAILCKMGQQSLKSHSQTLNEDDVKRIVQSVHGLIVDCYDGEAFLLWQPRKWGKFLAKIKSWFSPH